MRRFRLPLLILGLITLTLAADTRTDELRRRIVEVAGKYEGVPYIYGAESPQAFDCSGFVRYVYREAVGLSLPRNSKGQYGAGSPVSKAELRPGDVLVFDTVGGSPSHVAIYLGGERMIHAASEGPRTGVIVSRLDDRYFAPRFLGARRFLAEAEEGRAKGSAPPSEAPLQGKNAEAAASPSPAVLPQTKLEETPLAEIGFTLTSKRANYVDPIPTKIGTGVAFTLRNGTGTPGTFVAIFYKAEKDFSKSTEIHREIKTIAAGAALELPAYVFREPGVYKLIIKDSWNGQLLERVFKVVEAGH